MVRTLTSKLSWVGRTLTFVAVQLVYNLMLIANSNYSKPHWFNLAFRTSTSAGNPQHRLLLRLCLHLKS